MLFKCLHCKADFNVQLSEDSDMWYKDVSYCVFCGEEVASEEDDLDEEEYTEKDTEE